MRTNRYLIIAAIAAAVTLGGTAKAEIFVAGPAYAGVNQHTGWVRCLLFNAGKNVVVISNREIYHGFKGLLVEAGNNCTSALQPGKSCDYYVRGSTGTFTCRVVTTDSTDRLSGTLQFDDANGEPLLSIPLSR